MARTKCTVRKSSFARVPPNLRIEALRVCAPHTVLPANDEIKFPEGFVYQPGVTHPKEFWRSNHEQDVVYVEKAGVVVQSAPGAGYGLFTARGCEIPANTVVAEYTGEPANPEKQSDYIIESIDAYLTGSVARYVNDYRNRAVFPNAVLETFNGRVFLCTQENIPEQTEILVDYGVRYWTAKGGVPAVKCRQCLSWTSSNSPESCCPECFALHSCNQCKSTTHLVNNSELCSTCFNSLPLACTSCSLTKKPSDFSNVGRVKAVCVACTPITYNCPGCALEVYESKSTVCRECTSRGVVCCVCKVVKSPGCFDRKNISCDGLSVCIDCSNQAVGKSCGSCSSIQPRNCFSKSQWRKQNDRVCLTCAHLLLPTPMTCSICKVEKSARNFTAAQKKRMEERVCRNCSPLQHKRGREEHVEATTSSKRQNSDSPAI